MVGGVMGRNPRAVTRVCYITKQRARDRMEKENKNDLGRFPPPAGGLWADHRAHPLSPPRPPLAAAGLRVAGLRPVARVSPAAEIPHLLAGPARGPAPLGHRRPRAPDPPRRNPPGQRRI